ncbi:predicted protein [Histoplasma capsulatum var. duboisii H88]|uniref:Predicted protein n=1 Tax=Ajellomyces capsulatus (strain H88) TaxID=544711 RepID=F0UUC2_AJEC8|nr:predicted protein [Histoplasma capsulatum var. duboisii H88]
MINIVQVSARNLMKSCITSHHNLDHFGYLIILHKGDFPRLRTEYFYMIVDLAAVNELKAGLGNEADYEQFALKKGFASV